MQQQQRKQQYEYEYPVVSSRRVAFLEALPTAYSSSTADADPIHVLIHHGSRRIQARP